MSILNKTNIRLLMFIGIPLLLIAFIVIIDIANQKFQIRINNAVLAANNKAAKIIKGPYLQALTKDSVTILWETDKPSKALVDLFLDGKKIVSQKGETFRAKKIPNLEKLVLFLPKGYLHLVTIKNLKPETSYLYQIISKQRPRINGKFKTAPLPGGTYKLAAYGDSRSGHDQHRLIAAKIAGENPGLVLHTGDFVNRGYKKQEWQEFFDIIKVYSKSAVILPTYGNHEAGALTAFHSYFKTLFPFDGKHPASTSFRYADVFVLVLNAQEELTENSDLWKYMESNLKAVALDDSINYRFVMLHKPIYTWGHHEPDEIISVIDKEKLHKLFVKLKVNAVLAGHNHNYERFKRDSVTYLTLGGGGARLYNVKKYKVKTEAKYHQKSAKVYHYLIAAPSNTKNELEVKIINAETDMTIDSFALPAM